MTDRILPPTPTEAPPVESQAAGWQPMDTAPKDGTIILLYGGAYGGFPFSGKWDLGPLGETDRPWLNVINMSRLYAHVPEKWMSIPVRAALAAEGSAETKS